MICPDGPHQLREVLDWMSGENCVGLFLGFMTVLLAAEEGNHRSATTDLREVASASSFRARKHTTPSLILLSRALCARTCAIAMALVCPHPPCTHAPRPHTQTGPPVSATRPSLVLFSRVLCARTCVIATALAHVPFAVCVLTTLVPFSGLWPPFCAFSSTVSKSMQAQGQ